MNFFARLANFYAVHRGKGKCRMDYQLWAFWVLTGRYPRAALTANQAKSE